MRIRLITKQSSVRRAAPAGATLPETGFTSAEVLMATAALVVVIGSLYVPFSAAFRVVQSTRENLRATQIVMQKAEALSLFTSSQVRDTSNQPKPLFVERDNPLGGARNPGGSQYAGYLSAAGDLPSAFGANPSTATVTMCWTNYSGSKPIVRTRAIQTRLARNGMPKYIWGAL